MYRTAHEKIVTANELVQLVERLHAQGKRIVTTNGCFDLLHLGHCHCLEKARQLGDSLVCLVNSDGSVRRLKGSKRPIQSHRVRALQVAALEAVDHVVVFEEDTPEKALEKIRPAVHVKGGDYSPDDLPERRVVEREGGMVVCIPLLEGFSTTDLLRRVHQSLEPEPDQELTHR